MRALVYSPVIATLLSVSTVYASPAQTIVHADAKDVVTRHVTGKRAKTLAVVPANLGPISRIAVSASGNVAMLVGETRVARLALSGKSPTTVLVECHGVATLSPDGQCIACARGKRGIDIHRFGGKPTVRHSRVAAARVGFRGAKAVDLIARRGKELWAYRGGKPHERLAPHAPSGPWSVSPDGHRAAGVYETAPGVEHVLTFKLDGTAVKRRLLRDARPVSWSADSRWLLLQTKRAACIVRAIGGQYKCFKGYRAIHLSADGGHALLSRVPKDAKKPALYVGELAGARPMPPKKIVDDYAGAAAWRPAPASATPRPAAGR